jgi:hypothetical protein
MSTWSNGTFRITGLYCLQCIPQMIHTVYGAEFSFHFNRYYTKDDFELKMLINLVLSAGI